MRFHTTKKLLISATTLLAIFPVILNADKIEIEDSWIPFTQQPLVCIADNGPSGFIYIDNYKIIEAFGEKSIVDLNSNYVYFTKMCRVIE